MTKRKTLGRGLDALLSASPISESTKGSQALKELPIDLLQRGEYQPRVDMKEDKLKTIYI